MYVLYEQYYKFCCCCDKQLAYHIDHVARLITTGIHVFMLLWFTTARESSTSQMTPCPGCEHMGMHEHMCMHGQTSHHTPPHQFFFFFFTPYAASSIHQLQSHRGATPDIATPVPKRVYESIHLTVVCVSFKSPKASTQRGFSPTVQSEFDATHRPTTTLPSHACTTRCVQISTN